MRTLVSCQGAAAWLLSHPSLLGVHLDTTASTPPLSAVQTLPLACCLNLGWGLIILQAQQ
jgi:hypothetical protein